MILIVGGACQGKRRFALEKFAGEALSLNSPNVQRTDSPAEQVFLDGSQASWEEFLSGKYVCNLHRMIWRRLEHGEQPEDLEEKMAEELLEGCPGRIIVTDEIGYGIVPADRKEREYRELTGRICCKLAAKADQVWRVVAGLGMRIR